MTEKRLRGDTCFIKLIQNNGVAQSTWKAMGSFDLTTDNEVLKEDFLGEQSKRYDAIFNGFDFSTELQMFSTDEQVLEEAIVAKNQRRGPGQKFDITITTNYPSGKSTTRVLEDVEFGPIKTTYGGRTEFVKVTFEGSCSSASRIDG